MEAGPNQYLSCAQEALKVVQPSAKREGFATVPNVTWDDVGALEAIREELSYAILVEPLPLACQEMMLLSHCFVPSHRPL